MCAELMLRIDRTPDFVSSPLTHLRMRSVVDVAFRLLVSLVRRIDMAEPPPKRRRVLAKCGDGGALKYRAALPLPGMFPRVQKPKSRDSC